MMQSIFHRVSVREFTDDPVKSVDVEWLMRAAMAAPSACNQQPWEFYVVTDKEKIQVLSKVHQFARCAAGAPVIIVPVYRREGLTAPAFAQIDLSIAQENIWLETDSLGLGGVWLGIAPQPNRMQKVAEILGLPDHLEVFSIFAFGYPAETRQQSDRFDESRIHFVE